VTLIPMMMAVPIALRAPLTLTMMGRQTTVTVARLERAVPLGQHQHRHQQIRRQTGTMAMVTMVMMVTVVMVMAMVMK
jgi:hypothetical protein